LIREVLQLVAVDSIRLAVDYHDSVTVWKYHKISTIGGCEISIYFLKKSAGSGSYL
jgi:hypothetical protein